MARFKGRLLYMVRCIICIGLAYNGAYFIPPIPCTSRPPPAADSRPPGLLPYPAAYHTGQPTGAKRDYFEGPVCKMQISQAKKCTKHKLTCRT